MRADNIDLDFVPEENRLQLTELSGTASVTQPVTAKSKPLPGMKAASIHIEFQPDGRAVKRAVMTDRADLTLIGDENERRDVRADVISVTLGSDGQRATGLKAQGTVIIDLPGKRKTTPSRQIRSETLEAAGTGR